MTVRLNESQDPFVKLPQIMPEDTSIKQVREVSKARNEYAVMVKTRRGKKDLLAWIKGVRGVEEARINH